ncbi:MAG TPA: hypothetical protein VFN61_03315, partial [Acidimicrobiales bacterium]|nr:hypothetical protein [Acidimicrobiales bacterium]
MQLPNAARLSKLEWYLRRLQAMSGREILWRSQDQAWKLAWRSRQVKPGARVPGRSLLAGGQYPTFGAVLASGALAAVPAPAAELALDAAEQVMSGHWRALGVDRDDLVAPDWFYDPLTGRHAPSDKYCFDINSRDEAVTGNAKYVWELSRMHHVTVLVCAFALSGQERFATRAAEHLRSWWEQNPYLSGP